MAACIVVLTPRDAAALELTQIVSELAQVTNSLQSQLNNTSTSSSKKQSENNNSAAAKSSTPTQPVATVSPQAPPSSEALPPTLESLADLPPSREQLLSLVSEPLLDLDPLKYRSGEMYPDTDSFAVLRPSTEGWKFLGISWIWWVSGFGALWLGTRLRNIYVMGDA